jgi:beta-galactosidase
MLFSALSVALLVVGLVTGGGPQNGATARIRFTINDNWTYQPEGGTPQRVNLPHTWNIEDAFTEALDYRRGVGWYRKQLTLDSSLAGKQLFLFFEGANQVADVFVNGDSVGRHIGGYTAFAFDITRSARVGVNRIEVRVDNRHDDAIPPLNADFTFYGGIYRDVWLIATEPVHIDVLDHASPGVFVDAPQLDSAAAVVRVRGSVVNDGQARRRVTVRTRVLDAVGKEVLVLRTALNLPAGQRLAFDQRSARLREPRLWSPADPYVYTVITEVIEADRVVDRITNPLGFRWFAVDAQRGFSLNGRPHRLYGTNRHQDRSNYGNALPDELHRQDVRLVKQTGFNFLRLAHYPQDGAVLAEMDRAGLIGWEEIPVVNIISPSPAFADNAERMLVEMIRQHYNHPSILFWGYMNEVLLRKPNPMPDGYLDRVRALAERLERRAYTEDQTRKTVMAISIEEIDDGSGLQDVSDIIGFNLYFGWYYRDLAGLGAYLDSLHVRNPQRPIMVSEYGADSDERIHARSPVAFDFSTEHQQRFHEVQFPQMRDRSYLIGTAVWNQFDFGSKGRHDSKPNLNQKGLLYYDRSPKDVWYLYRALLATTPVIHIASRDWPVRAGSSDSAAMQPIKVYTNASRAELIVNGVSAGTTTPDNAVATWTVRLRDGANHLVARADNGAADEFVVRYEDRSSLFADAPTAARIIAVNAGSHYDYVDRTGTTWQADQPYRRGGWGYVGAGTRRLRHHRIFGSMTEDALYQAHHEGAREYRFDVKDGTYDVRVLFAENEVSEAGKRMFSVGVNGVAVFTNIDLFAHYGRYVAVDRTVTVNAEGSGVVITLEASAGTPTISGIQLRRID